MRAAVRPAAQTTRVGGTFPDQRRLGVVAVLVREDSTVTIERSVALEGGDRLSTWRDGNPYWLGGNGWQAFGHLHAFRNPQQAREHPYTQRAIRHFTRLGYTELEPGSDDFEMWADLAERQWLSEQQDAERACTIRQEL